MPPEMLAGQPLCMHQYVRMFNSCRVPGETVDEVVVTSEPIRHIVVLHNSALYAFDVLDSAGNMLPFANIVAYVPGVHVCGLALACVFTLARHAVGFTGNSIACVTWARVL
jgi:hypothetical protein